MNFLRRFELKIEDKQEVMIPFNSEVVGLTVAGETPYLWAIVPDGASPIKHQIIMTTENKELDYRCNRTKHVGMFMIGKDMLHVFDLT